MDCCEYYQCPHQHSCGKNNSRRAEIRNRSSLVTNRITKGVKKESSSLITKGILKRQIQTYHLVSLQTWSQKTSLRSGGAGLVLSTMLIPTRKCLNWVRIANIVEVKQKSMNRPVDQLIQLKIVIIFSKWIVQGVSDPGDAAIFF